MRSDLQKYGPEDFKVEVVESTASKHWANELERREISRSGSILGGYNKLRGKPGGDPTVLAIINSRKKKLKPVVIDLT